MVVSRDSLAPSAVRTVKAWELPADAPTPETER